MPFPKFPSLQEIRDAKPLPQGAGQQPGMPTEPIARGRPLSTYIPIYLVVIPILFIVAVAYSSYSHSRLGLPLFSPDVIFSIVELVIMIGFNALGFSAVRHMIPEYMSVFIYFYIINAGVKMAWSAVYAFVLFRQELPTVINGKAVVLDQSLISQVLLTTFLISTVMTLLYTWWIVVRMFIPFREYALACRKVLEGGNDLSENATAAPVYAEVTVGKVTA
ncbi:hypothetical protein HDU98_011225 [Podochytrium sp. JEL0797]|nr:hypothetical protein HDU98_011225 [Podochytrium sp. JEL0797]